MLIIVALIVGAAAGLRVNRALGIDSDRGRRVLIGIAGSLVGFTALSLVSGDGLAIGPSALLGTVGGAILALSLEPSIRASNSGAAAGDATWPLPRE
jgi:hypothetical protein